MKSVFMILLGMVEKIKTPFIFLVLLFFGTNAHSKISLYGNKSFRSVIQKDTVAAVTREEIKEAMERIYLGKGPKPGSTPKSVMEIIEKVKQPDHERWYIKYLVDKDEYAYAYILLPLNMAKGKKLPLVMCLHPTSEIGKDRVAGIYKTPAKDEKERTGRENRQYALELVRRGYIAFAPDRAAYGKRRSNNGRANKAEMAAYHSELSKKYPGWTLNGKVIYDLKKALDFLTALDFVDSSNIATIGHSLGAWDSIFLIAFDERVKAAVINSGGMMNYRPELWKNPEALRTYLKDNAPRSINTDVNIYLMLAAPRSVLYQFSLFDSANKGGKQLIEGFRDVTDYYTKVNKSKKVGDINYYLHGNGHDFTKESRELSYAWLDQRLKHE